MIWKIAKLLSSQKKVIKTEKFPSPSHASPRLKKQEANC
jgi:hypothetical protein